MKLVTNDARRGRLLAFGHELGPGATVLMTDAAAAQLAADPHVQVTVRDEPKPQGAGAAPGEGHDDALTLEEEGEQ
jgi:hypothetical protein